jgi:hypothetical protein
MTDKMMATLVAWLLGSPIYLPWLLARLGLYKSWYFAKFIPPFSWRGWIQLWPLSAVFVCMPFIALLPVNDDLFMTLWAGIGVGGIIFAIVLVIINPRWAKPAWQRRLEDRYSYEMINNFIEVWRQMDFAEWSQLVETEEGLEKLVKIAQEGKV